MVRKLNAKDFRARRYVLEPHDFALGGEEPEPAPTDLIEKEAWHGIMTLPCDVSIRTTSHQGARVSLLHELLSDWIAVFPEGGIIGEAMLDSADAFQAATFNLVHGFYKEAISALRNALEAMTLATKCELSGDLTGWKAWQAEEEIKYKQVCDKIPGLPPFRQLECSARKVATTSLFAGDDGGGRRAWATNLFNRLSHFSHACGDSSNAHLWQSNGPIYSAEGMKVSYYLYLETHAVCLLLAKACVPKSRPVPNCKVGNEIRLSNAIPK